MANIYSIVYFVLGVIVTHSCLLVWTALLLPASVERARRRIEVRPTSSLLIGVLGCVLTGAVIGGFLLVRIAAVGWVDGRLQSLSDHLHFSRFYNDAWIITNGVTWLLAIPLFAGFIVGGAGFTQLFAVRARLLMRDDRPLAALTYGAVCTSAAYFLPLIGWFVFLPVVGLMSIGAGLCGILMGRRTPSESQGITGRRPEAVGAAR